MSTSGMHRRPFEGRHLVESVYAMIEWSNVIVFFWDRHNHALIYAVYFTVGSL